ncbi:MAG: carboxylate--amine ligase [Deltaproteobacteria bacterium]|nr:MAG: carboxylate--amine ligase [Deltaproteobacteria bacterium]
MLTTLIVVDDPGMMAGSDLADMAISFKEYLEEHPKKDLPKLRVINICDTIQHLGSGYYCSLLAEARGHKVFPSVNTITDLRNSNLYLAKLGSAALKGSSAASSRCDAPEKELLIFFGNASDQEFQPLAKKVFNLFPAPILKVSLLWRSGWYVEGIERFGVSDLTPDEKSAFWKALKRFTERAWSRHRSKKRHRWEMAILYDPEEVQPPSDRVALRKLIGAASKVGILAELITSADYAQLSEYDALFLRETTAIDHHTYRFALKAEVEGMVVIDDTDSILRCCNKVFLHDAFTYNDVPALKSQAVFNSDERTLDHLEEIFSYPIVLKLPESSFSKGVFKVDDRKALSERLRELLSQTPIVLAQEYLYTEFDWRIGVLNHRPLYACRYFMARNHWQIYKYGEKKTVGGGFETLPTFEVPRVVLEAAIKAAKVVGNGLYGVDIKQQGSKAYVIEINDNPSIESKVEDAYLGDELYMLIMSEFARRLENRGRQNE